MTLRVIISSLMLVGLSIVQATWLQTIAVFGVKPDLGLLMVAWLAYKKGPVEGSAAGFISGLFDDAMSAAPLGFNTSLKTVAAWAASLLHGSLQLDRIMMPAIMGAAVTIFKAIWTGFLALLFGPIIATYNVFGRTFWAEVGYNAAVAPILFLILGAIFSILDSGRRNSR